ncbi:TlpA family protein disulfide reductase [Nonomuraea sp. NPDC059007]|uniref:TlpA family protein disulfide reductase n=1 Tax=Nonomuraea sp. NPDC059007 TaxID=3346692 RepID=UPI0036761A18
MTTAVVVLLGLLCLFNVVLTAGVIRRLREHTSRLDELSGIPRLDSMQPAGGKVGAFKADLAGGGAIISDELEGTFLVAAFTQGCPACKDALPDFVELTKEFRAGRERTLALLVGEPAKLTRELGKLEPVAQIIMEAVPGPVAAALGVQGYPAIGLVDFSAGIVHVAGTRPEHVRRFTTIDR